MAASSASSGTSGSRTRQNTAAAQAATASAASETQRRRMSQGMTTRELASSGVVTSLDVAAAGCMNADPIESGAS